MTGARWMVLLTAVYCCLNVVPALAQPTIPNNLLNPNGALNADQTAVLRSYTDYWLDSMVTAVQSEDFATVATARTNLSSPLTQTSNSIFRQSYSIAFVDSATSRKVMAAESPHVRLNTMIVASRMVDVSVIKLIEMGLADPTPAPRYWAAKAISQLVGANARGGAGISLQPKDEQRLLNALKLAIAQESSPQVFEQLLSALVELRSLTASKIALTQLTERLDTHARGIEQLNIGADLLIFSMLSRNLVDQVAAGNQVDQQLLKDVASLSFKYYVFTAESLDPTSALRVPEGKTKTYKDLLKFADQMLVWTVKQIVPAEALENRPTIPANRIANDVDLNNAWAKILLTGEDWRTVLQAKAKIPASELELKPLG